jgi:hypothetical protein
MESAMPTISEKCTQTGRYRPTVCACTEYEINMKANEPFPPCRGYHANVNWVYVGP